MEDYYPDEISIIMEEYAELNRVNNKDEIEVSADDF